VTIIHQSFNKVVSSAEKKTQRWRQIG